MPVFHAVYYTQLGRKRAERVEAVDAASLEQALRQRRRVFPISITEAGAKQSKKGIYRFKVKTAILLSMMDSMEVLLQSGVTISMVLRTLVDRSKPGNLRFMWAELAAQVEQDGSLANGMVRFPRVFPEAARGMIFAGEKNGRLPEAIKSVRDYLSDIEDVQNTAKQASFTPAIAACMGFVTVSVLMLFTLPRFEAMIEAIGSGDMNPLTGALFHISRFVGAHRLFCGAVVLSVPASIVMAFKSQAARRVIDQVSVRVPKIRDVVWALALARICPTFRELYLAGVAAHDCLPLCERVAGNKYISDRLAKVGEWVRRNESIGDAFEKAGGFPMEIVVTLKSGEGKLEIILERMAAYYSRQAKYLVGILLKALEPAMILVVGGIALLVALAMFLPMISILRNIRH